MNMNSVIETLKECIQKNIRLVPLIEGQPGVGKSSVIYQAAKALGLPVIEFRPANHGIEDLIGLPTFNEDKTKASYAIPDWLPNEERDGEKGILFIDEFMQANPAMQSALSQLIYDKRVHDYFLPKGWTIVAATNSSKHRAATHKMPTHIADRTVKVEAEFGLDAWLDWAYATNLDPAIIAFAKWRPAVLDSFDPKLETNCTPRSLAACSEYMTMPDTIRNPLIQGTIGDGAAAELVGFLSVWTKLPDLDIALKNPKLVTIPQEPDVLYALTTALSHRANPQTMPAITQIIERVPNEFQVMFFKDATRRDQKICTTAEFKTFLANNKELLA